MAGRRKYEEEKLRWLVDPPGGRSSAFAPRHFATYDEAVEHVEEYNYPPRTRIVDTRVEEYSVANGEGAVTPKDRALVSAADFCELAAELVSGPREAAHGDKLINFKNIASIWNALLEIKWRKNGGNVHEPPQVLDAGDVGDFMEAFKIARRHSGSYNPDDYVDAAGYAGCTGQIRAQEARDGKDD